MVAKEQFIETVFSWITLKHRFAIYYYYYILGMGIGFTAALVLMGMIRELLGAGTLFGVTVTANFITPMTLMLLPPGGFFVFGILIALANKLSARLEKAPTKSCDGNCISCPACPSNMGGEEA